MQHRLGKKNILSDQIKFLMVKAPGHPFDNLMTKIFVLKIITEQLQTLNTML